MRVDINGHIFTDIAQIIESIDTSDTSLPMANVYTPTPTKAFKDAWEDPKGQRGSLDKFKIEHIRFDEFLLIAASDWSNEQVNFWHEKVIVHIKFSDIDMYM